MRPEQPCETPQIGRLGLLHQFKVHVLLVPSLCEGWLASPPFSCCVPRLCGLPRSRSRCRNCASCLRRASEKPWPIAIHQDVSRPKASGKKYVPKSSMVCFVSEINHPMFLIAFRCEATNHFLNHSGNPRADWPTPGINSCGNPDATRRSPQAMPGSHGHLCCARAGAADLGSAPLDSPRLRGECHRRRLARVGLRNLSLVWLELSNCYFPVVSW